LPTPARYNIKKSLADYPVAGDDVPPQKIGFITTFKSRFTTRTTGKIKRTCGVWGEFPGNVIRIFVGVVTKLTPARLPAGTMI